MLVRELLEQDDLALLEHQINQALQEAGLLKKLKGLALAGLAAASMLGAGAAAAKSGDTDASAQAKPAAVAKADAATSSFGSVPSEWKTFHSSENAKHPMADETMNNFVFDTANILKPAPDAVGLVLKNQLLTKVTTKTGGWRVARDGDETLVIFHLKAKKFAHVTGGKLDWKDVPSSGLFAEAFKVAQGYSN